jgi:hypothetical protein
MAAITTSSAPLAVWERSRSPVNTGPSSARTWEASSGGLLVKKESANFRAAQLQSTLRVTAYAIAKKGLSIGMVNKKGFAVYFLQEAIDLDSYLELRTIEFACKSTLLLRSGFGTMYGDRYDFFANGMPDAPGLYRRGIWPG